MSWLAHRETVLEGHQANSVGICNRRASCYLRGEANNTALFPEKRP